MPTTHVLLIPFHTSGHIIPLLDLADKLLSRNFTVTVLVTPSNLPLLQLLQSVYSPEFLRTLVLPFPEVSPPSLAATIRASSQLRQPILEWFRSHPLQPVAIFPISSSAGRKIWRHKISVFLGSCFGRRLLFLP